MIIVAVVVVLFFVAIFFAVMRGSAGLLKKRLQDDPSLAQAGDVDVDEMDGLPLDIEY